MSREYLIDPILPCNEIHLIGGPSGAGKTTWLFQMLCDWQAGKAILGFESHPCAWKYLSADRSMATTQETLRRVNAKVFDDQIHSLIETHSEVSVDSVLRWCDKHFKGGGLLILDGFLSLTPGGRINDYDTVKGFLTNFRNEMAKRHITVLGSVHSTKVRENDLILNPRQRVAGTVAWAGFSETIFIIEPASYKKEEESHHRILHILPRNAAEFQLRLQFDGRGILVEQAADVENTVMLAKLLKLAPGTALSSETLQEWGKAEGISRRSIFRWIDEAMRAGQLERVSKGQYRVPFKN